MKVAVVLGDKHRENWDVRGQEGEDAVLGMWRRQQSGFCFISYVNGVGASPPGTGRAGEEHLETASAGRACCYSPVYRKD